MLTFTEYQKGAMSTAIYPICHVMTKEEVLQRIGFTYPALGLAGEAGELAEKFKKIIRDNEGMINDDKQKELAKELGDVLWYVAALCTELGLNMEEVAAANLAKLASRKDRGVIQGSGDNR